MTQIRLCDFSSAPPTRESSVEPGRCVPEVPTSGWDWYGDRLSTKIGTRRRPDGMRSLWGAVFSIGPVMGIKQRFLRGSKSEDPAPDALIFPK